VLCPFHKEKTASCVVYENDGGDSFYCFGCGEGGDCITFVAKTLGVSAGQAMKVMFHGVKLDDSSVPYVDSSSFLMQRVLVLSEISRRISMIDSKVSELFNKKIDRLMLSQTYENEYVDEIFKTLRKDGLENLKGLEV